MKILDGGYFAEKHLHYMYTTLEKQKKKPKKLAGGPKASSSSSRLLIIFINANAFRIYFFH